MQNEQCNLQKMLKTRIKLLLCVWNWKWKRHHFKLSSTVNCGSEVLVLELFFPDCMLLVWQSEAEGFSLKKPSRGLWPTPLAPCECIIQHQVVNKTQIRIQNQIQEENAPFDHLNWLLWLRNWMFLTQSWRPKSILPMNLLLHIYA